MPLKPLERLTPARRARPSTRKMNKAKTNAQMRDERLKNLAKARRVRKKNLLKAKQAAKS